MVCFVLFSFFKYNFKDSYVILGFICFYSNVDFVCCCSLNTIFHKTDYYGYSRLSEFYSFGLSLFGILQPLLIEDDLGTDRTEL